MDDGGFSFAGRTNSQRDFLLIHFKKLGPGFYQPGCLVEAGAARGHTPAWLRNRLDTAHPEGQIIIAPPVFL
jgi:hypothetical protein